MTDDEILNIVRYHQFESGSLPTDTLVEWTKQIKGPGGVGWALSTNVAAIIVAIRMHTGHIEHWRCCFP